MALGPFSAQDHVAISTLGLEFAVAQAAGFAAGYWLDGRFQTRPVFMLAGLAVGFALGLYIVIKAAKEMDKTSTLIQKADKKDGRS